MIDSPALDPLRFLRSVEASRGTLGKPEMRLIDLVVEVRKLTNDAPYSVIGGLAQILWARKSHTDDLDVALAAADLSKAYEAVRAAGEAWSLPGEPLSAHAMDDVLEVYHSSSA
jgi:hypothetical protein